MKRTLVKEPLTSSLHGLLNHHKFASIFKIRFRCSFLRLRLNIGVKFCEVLFSPLFVSVFGDGVG